MIRRATLSDVDTIMGIVRSAQQSLRELGIDQWQDGYPSPDSIKLDIDAQVGYVACDEDSIVGYAAIVLTGEPAYKQIAELWHTSERYVVVHRLCVLRGSLRRGVAIELMRYAANVAREHDIVSFRVDTHKGNIRMLSLLDKLGFEHVGLIRYESGEREAFDLKLMLSNML
jgi:ribosomal protein S18 acetylase RimI-like enzyme